MTAVRNQRPLPHARSDVVASRWDEVAQLGYWTFRCQTCKHEWEEAARFTQRPLVGRAMGKHAWALYARYWGAGAGGVKVKCRKCKAGGGR